MQLERDEEIRRRLEQERSIIIQDQKPTDGLIRALKEVFKLYVVENDPIVSEKGGNDDEMKENDNDTNLEEVDDLFLSRVMATRLWYRCGMSISDLNKLLDTKPHVKFQDFLDRIVKAIEDDVNLDSPPDVANSIYDTSKFEVRFLMLVCLHSPLMRTDMFTFFEPKR